MVRVIEYQGMNGKWYSKQIADLIDPLDKKKNFNNTQQLKVADCHLHNVGLSCRYVYGWKCQEQCCIVPCQSTTV